MEATRFIITEGTKLHARKWYELGEHLVHYTLVLNSIVQKFLILANGHL